MQICWHMSFQSGHMQCPGRGLGNMLAIMNKQYLSYMIIWVSVKFMKLEKKWVICIVNQNRSFSCWGFKILDAHYIIVLD